MGEKHLCRDTPTFLKISFLLVRVKIKIYNFCHKRRKSQGFFLSLFIKISNLQEYHVRLQLLLT